MLNSPLLKSNPNLYVFLPILYSVWSDAVLTPSEVKTLKDLIESQSWLKQDEKSLLLQQLDPLSPPTPDEFKEWLAEIKKAADKINPATQPMLVDIGINLAQLHNGSGLSESLKLAKTSMAHV